MASDDGSEVTLGKAAPFFASRYPLPLLATAQLLATLASLILLVWILIQLRRPADRLAPLLREEMRAAREETLRAARELREEITTQQSRAAESTITALRGLGDGQQGQFQLVAEATRAATEASDRAIKVLVQQVREELTRIQEITASELAAGRRTIDDRLNESKTAFDQRSAAVETRVQELAAASRADQQTQRTALLRQLLDVQETSAGRFEDARSTLVAAVDKGLDAQAKGLETVVAGLRGLEATHRQEQESARTILEEGFRRIQEGNERKLDEMRATVDEKLHRTLEDRLGASFKSVSEHLEAVHRGLGEMKGLATGVGDLKRVLTGVRDRGTWGEYQLSAILEQILAPSQYARNVATKGEGERVEFAIKLPGQDSSADQPVWLPIDAKFPKSDYDRLMEASQAGDVDAVEVAKRALLAALRTSAREIQSKYVAPPHTTDFAIMFLPTEGLYAEAIRHPGFQDELQRDYRIIIAGPTTMSAILTSLRVGFQTVAIGQRADEIRTVLRAVKTEFSKFDLVLEKVRKHLTTASNSLDKTSVRTRAMERKLREVEQLPDAEAAELLALSEANDDEDEAETGDFSQDGSEPEGQPSS